MNKIITYLEKEGIVLTDKQKDEIDDMLLNLNMAYAYDMHDPT